MRQWQVRDVLMEQEFAEITEMISLFPPSALFAKEPVMHSLFSQAAGLTHGVIAAAIEVHKEKGPTLLESIYEGASD